MKKYKLTTNLPLKIIAFVFAAFLWLIVANVANPVTKSTYTNIKVTIANDDVLTVSVNTFLPVGSVLICMFLGTDSAD